MSVIVTRLCVCVLLHISGILLVFIFSGDKRITTKNGPDSFVKEKKKREFAFKERL